MSEYLTKEEIRQWRSSLDKITLEEFAQRLGKKINEQKQTNDLVDIVMKKDVTQVAAKVSYKIESLPEPKVSRPVELNPQKVMEPIIEVVKKEVPSSKPIVKTQPAVKKVEKPSKSNVAVKEAEPIVSNSSEYNFSKALTDREQAVFEHFKNNKGKVVYAKDLATLLDLPRDYVYKYIKTLRAKLLDDVLENSEKGGYTLIK